MIGIINIKNRKYTLADIHITNSNVSEKITINDYKNIGKCFDGDLVELTDDCRCVKKVIKNNIKDKTIPGILLLKSKYKYGFNKRGIEIFQFKPFNRSLPIFNVASKIKKKLIKTNQSIENQYITITYLKWSDTCPQGEIKHLIGSMNILDNKYEILLHKYDIYKSKPRFKLDKNFDNELFINLRREKYLDLTKSGLHFYSIDPGGCRDIDDVLSHDIDNNRIGIHIADVGTYIKYFELNNIVSERHTSIYLPFKQINMIPDILATDICSLHPNKRKLVFTIWLYYNDDEIIDTKIEKNIIISSKAYTYDEADKIFNKKNIFKLSKRFGKKYLKYDTKKWSTHEMVEVYMILANHYVAKFLMFNQHKLGNNLPIFRIHKEKIKRVQDKNIDHTLQKMVNIFNSNKAEYIIGNNIVNNIVNNKYYHYGLDIYYYTHFTSPIRREVDIYIHNLLDKILYDSYVNISPDCNKINETTNKIKKMERDINKIKIIEYLNYCSNNNFDAFIFDIKQKVNGSVNFIFYIPEFKFLYEIEVINEKLLNILELKFEENKLLIKNRETSKKCEFKKYSKIIIQLYKLNDEEIVNLGIYIKYLESVLK